MKRALLLCVIVLAYGVSAMAADIAFYVGAPNTDGWYTVDAMTTDVETIIAQTGNLFKDVKQFNDDQFPDFEAWVQANMDDGELDIIWLNGCMPSVLYPFPNLQPDGSLAEEWLNHGNMIINVGDWFGYVSYEGGVRNSENGGTGAANILNLASGIIVSADGTTLPVTDAGREYLPSLDDPAPTSRPIGLSAVAAPWEVAAVFAQNAAGTQADPVVLHNTETGAYVAFINQGGTGSWLTDRGLTCSELISNWIATVIGLGNPSLAYDPSPEDGAIDVPRDVVLSWMPGEYAATHDVYFGTSFDDVNTASRSNPMDLLVSENQTGTTFDLPDILDFETTYYWRVDEVNAAPDNTIYKGTTWSFTAEPFAYPVTNIVATSNGISEDRTGPQNTVNGSGLTADDQHSIASGDMWLAKPVEGESLWIQYEFDRLCKLHQMLVWNYNEQFEMILGFGLKDVTVEYSQDGAEWTVLGDVQLNQATASATYTANTAIDFEGVAAKFVRLTVNSGWGGMGQYGLSEVRFMYIPVQAREPQPADGAADVSVESALAWRAGRDAVSHEVYLGADPDALEPAATVAGTSYAPGALNLATTYYWQVNAAQETESWDGAVWSFATQDYLVVDDFESYTDDIDAGEAIFDTWL
ncbi:MAG: discoidin domain-containing protein, partial [Planctomycetota bacterium]|nr:discoidin domain-containing protein [Planctomycetota bacterium]